MQDRNRGVPLDGFEPIDWQKFRSDLRAAEEWLASLEIKIPNGSRLWTYQRHVEGLAEADAREDINSYARTRDVGADAIANAVLEASEWRIVHRAFQDYDSPELRQRLRAFVRGVVHSREERPGKGKSTRARDYGFELFIAARFRCAGFEAVVGGSGDVWLPFEGKQIFVECKRPQVRGRLKDAIKDAHTKLKKRYRSTNLECRGLVALSATKVLNPQGHRLSTANWPELREDLERRADHFIQTYSRNWTRLDDPRSLGALVEFQCMAWIRDGPHLATAGNVSLHYAGLLGTDDHDLSLRLLERYPHSGGFYRRRLS